MSGEIDEEGASGEADVPDIDLLDFLLQPDVSRTKDRAVVHLNVASAWETLKENLTSAQMEVPKIIEKGFNLNRKTLISPDEVQKRIFYVEGKVAKNVRDREKLVR